MRDNNSLVRSTALSVWLHPSEPASLPNPDVGPSNAWEAGQGK